ncbi:stage II sporulation protein M [Chlamydia vaughanii]|uniref:stage II sporulation protein M n=1 Tax=Chlamydia vaughanii TaxID=3112552 RepID=UPI0032B1AD1A
MSGPKPIQPTFNLFSVNAGKSFSDKNPKAARALQISGMIVAVLAVFAAVALVMATPIGLPLSLGLGGVLLGIGGSLLFASVMSLAHDRKKVALEKKKELVISAVPPKRISPSSVTGAQSWEAYNEMVDEFSKLETNLSDHDRKVFESLGKDHGVDILSNLEKITQDFEKAKELLSERKQVYSDEIITESISSAPQQHQARNDLFVLMGRDILDALPRSGGVLSIRNRNLSPAMSKIHTGISVGLVVGGIACLGLIAAIVPGGLIALPMIIAAALGISIAVLALSYGIKELLKRTKTNRKQLAKELKNVIDIDLLEKMTKSQEHVLRGLRVTLETDIWMTKKIQPIMVKYNRIHQELTDLEEHAAELAFKYKQIVKSLNQRAEMLLKGSHVSQARSGEEKRTQVSPEEEEDEGFEAIASRGIEAAQQRRQAAGKGLLHSYEEHLTPEEMEFAEAWVPKGERHIEDFWAKKLENLSDEDRLLLSEGIDKNLRSVQKEMNVLHKHIQRTRLALENLEESKQKTQSGSEKFLDLLKTVARSNSNLLDVLTLMQESLLGFLESEEEIRRDY